MFNTEQLGRAQLQGSWVELMYYNLLIYPEAWESQTVRVWIFRR